MVDTTTLHQLIMRYSKVFQSETGTMQGVQVHLTLREGATPRFFRPRPVPFAMRERVGRELDRLEECEILHKVDHSEWAAPVVPVPKRDGSV